MSDQKEWWNRPDADAGEVQAAMNALKNGAHSKETLFEMYAKLYGCTNTRHLCGASNRIPPHQAGITLSNGRLNYNILRSVVDALVARIGSKKPRIRFLTTGAAYKSRRKAQNFTQWTDGLFYQNKTHELGKQVFRDGCVFGTGLLKVFSANDTVCHARTPITEVYMDDDNTGHVHAWYQEKTQVSPDQLRDLFPDQQDQFKDITKDVDVTEAWYTPMDADGRWVITVDQETIVDDEWKFKTPPFSVFRWKEPLFGFLGESVFSELLEIQAEITWLLQKSQEMMNMQSWHVFLSNTAGIKSSRITNAPITVHTKNSESENPFVLPIPGVPPEILERIEALESKAYKLIGLSEMWTQSEKPAGLNSQPALQQYESIQSARYTHIEQSLHVFYSDVAVRSIELANHLAEEGTPVKVFSDFGSGLNEVVWKKTNLDKESYQLRANPSSILPITPAGQLEFVTNMAQNDQSMATYMLSLIDFPDVKAALQRHLAPQLLAERMIDDVMCEGKVTEPDEHMDLVYALKQAKDGYCQAILDDDDPDTIEKLSVLITKIEGKIQPPAPATPPPVAPMAQAAPADMSAPAQPALEQPLPPAQPGGVLAA